MPRSAIAAVRLAMVGPPTGSNTTRAPLPPVSFFTSQSLSQRSGDLSNLLDGISNGIQSIQAANQGITSIQKLVDQAKSVANQALQLHGGYGYLSEYGIEKIVRDLRVHQILEGTNEIMRLIVARKLIEAQS